MLSGSAELQGKRGTGWPHSVTEIELLKQEQHGPACATKIISCHL
jgi:hypothetical protein